jgi:predicted Zn-dependent peptidase
MSNLARQEIYFGRHISLDEIARRVDAVTADEVLAVARELFGPGSIALTVLGPLNGTRIKRSELAC